MKDDYNVMEEYYFQSFDELYVSFVVFVECVTLLFCRPIVKLPPMPLGAIVFGEGASSDGLPEWEVWAQKELMSVGSDLRAKFLNLQVNFLSLHISC